MSDLSLIRKGSYERPDDHLLGQDLLHNRITIRATIGPLALPLLEELPG